MELCSMSSILDQATITDTINSLGRLWLVVKSFDLELKLEPKLSTPEQGS